MPQSPSPKVLRGGLVLLDGDGRSVLRVISLQYNPDTLSRSLQVRGTATDAGDRLEVTRLKGPPAETIKLEAEIDATDQLEFPGSNKDTVTSGVLPQLAALEVVVSPSSASLQAAQRLAGTGALEVLPLPAPLVLFVWGSKRVLPVRITDVAILEEAFDANLNPIRAKVTLSLRVMSVDDMPAGSRGQGLAMAALQTKEQWSRRQPGTLQSLGIQSLP
jgi:hypothetical protein